MQYMFFLKGTFMLLYHLTMISQSVSQNASVAKHMGGGRRAQNNSSKNIYTIERSDQALAIVLKEYSKTL
jgi:hypothetical protein